MADLPLGAADDLTISDQARLLRRVPPHQVLTDNLTVETSIIWQPKKRDGLARYGKATKTSII